MTSVLTNAGDIAKRHRWFLREHDQMVGQLVTLQARTFAADHIRNRSGFRHRTHRTRKATTYKTIRTRGGKALRIANRSKVGRFLEGGTRPHLIRAKRKKALSFMAGGKRVVRTSVNHPGTKPYRFLLRAAHFTHSRLGPRLRRSMTRLAKRF